ncbi:MAG: hypothetical protein V1867_01440 [Candidatus Falkowbacteria bacterium]
MAEEFKKIEIVQVPDRSGPVKIKIVDEIWVGTTARVSFPVYDGGPYRTIPNMTGHAMCA